MNIQEKPPPGGLQASQHASEHPQSTNNTSGLRGMQREEGYQPSSQSAPRGSPATPNGPQGHKEQRKALKENNTANETAKTLMNDLQKALDAPQALSSLALLSLIQRATTTIAHQMENQTTLATILNAINKTQKPSDQPTPLRTWAQAVAQCQPAPPG
jgi:hypothetical protein